MSRLRSAELQIEGYTAKVRGAEITIARTNASFNQRDDRAHELVLTIPARDAPRVAALITDAHETARGVEGSGLAVDP